MISNKVATKSGDIEDNETLLINRMHCTAVLQTASNNRLPTGSIPLAHTTAGPLALWQRCEGVLVRTRSQVFVPWNRPLVAAMRTSAPGQSIEHPQSQLAVRKVQMECSTRTSTIHHHRRWPLCHFQGSEHIIKKTKKKLKLVIKCWKQLIKTKANIGLKYEPAEFWFDVDWFR